MKVAILCPGFGWVNRGVERITEEIASRLGADFQPIIYRVRTKNDAGKSSEFAECSVPAISRNHFLARAYSKVARRAGIYLWSPGDFEAMTFATNLFPRLLADKPELVLNFGGIQGDRICKILRRLRGTPFLHSAQGMAQGRLELLHAQQRPDRYLATSLPNKEWVEARAPWLKTCLLPNGVDCSLFSPEGEVASIPLPPPIILFVGAIDPVKRPDLTIQAVARLNRDSGKGASLLMIGDGRISKQMEKLGREQLGERFHLSPSLPHDSLPAYFRAASVFTLASPEEPFGIVFIEAMATNLAVVAHQAEVQKWLIGDAGICCDCENIEAYATALQQALATDYGAAPRRRALQFEWADIVREYESVFTEVLAERNRWSREIRQA